MIELNFLPQEERAKKKALAKIPAGLPVKIFSIVLVILLGIHVVITLIIIGGRFYLGRLTAKAGKALPRSVEIAKIREEIKDLEAEQAIINELFGKQIIWAEKLNIISDDIVVGVWLRRLTLVDKLFSLEGTAVSLKGEEMKMIGSFLDKLKAQKYFYSDFSDLALKSIQRRYMGQTEVVDFIIAGLLK